MSHICTGIMLIMIYASDTPTEYDEIVKTDKDIDILLDTQRNI